MSRSTFSSTTDLKCTESLLTAKEIDDILRDNHSPLAGIGCAVMSAASKYGVNATYIIAHIIHETAWGSSRLCREKHNLFGWGAFDKSPYESSKAFPSWPACIDFVVGRINEMYLTDGGRWFAGCFLGERDEQTGHGIGMNANYATDPLWGKKIAAIGRILEDY